MMELSYLQALKSKSKPSAIKCTDIDANPSTNTYTKKKSPTMLKGKIRLLKRGETINVNNDTEWPILSKPTEIKPLTLNNPPVKDNNISLPILMSNNDTSIDASTFEDRVDHSRQISHIQDLIDKKQYPCNQFSGDKNEIQRRIHNQTISVILAWDFANKMHIFSEPLTQQKYNSGNY